MELQFDMIGAPTYATALRGYTATIPLAKMAASTDILPLFVIPKGSTILAAKVYVDDVTDGSYGLNIGTYTLAEDGTIGAAVDADMIVAAKTVSSTNASGDLLAIATTAKAQVTADVVVQVAPTVTTAATKGTVRVEVVTLP